MGEPEDNKMDALQKALRALEVMFAEKLPGRLLEIEQALNQYEQNKSDPAALNTLYRLLHTMAGSAGTFGFADVGSAARALETRLKPLLSGGVWGDAESSQFSSDVRSYLSASLPGATNQAPSP